MCEWGLTSVRKQNKDGMCDQDRLQFYYTHTHIVVGVVWSRTSHHTEIKLPGASLTQTSCACVRGFQRITPISSCG